jgi:hypothetical protein
MNPFIFFKQDIQNGNLSSCQKFDVVFRPAKNAGNEARCLVLLHVSLPNSNGKLPTPDLFGQDTTNAEENKIASEEGFMFSFRKRPPPLVSASPAHGASPSPSPRHNGVPLVEPNHHALYPTCVEIPDSSGGPGSISCVALAFLSDQVYVCGAGAGAGAGGL